MHLLKKTLLLATNVAWASFCWSQTNAPSPASEESVELSPFTVAVDKDEGYIAGDSLVSGRIATNLLTSPQDVSVLTREFLNDIAATSPEDAARWLTGALVEAPSQFGDFGNSVTFRGLGNVNGGYPSRNYFRYNGGVDGYIADRYEGARGPNSLLFGEGVVSGVFNTMTKRARFGRAFSEFRARVTSEGGYRLTADLNQNITRDVALRINLLKEEGKKWLDNWRDDKDGLHLTGSWRPWNGAELRLEGEWVNRDRIAASPTWRDAVTNYDGSFEVTSMFSDNAALRPTPPTSAGVTRQGRRYVIGSQLGGTDVYNMQTYGYTTGVNAVNSLSTNVDLGKVYRPAISRELNLTPSNAVEKNHYRVLSAFFTQDIGRDFSFELGAQRARIPHNGPFTNRWNIYTLDVNRFLPDGRSNPNFRKAFAETQINDNVNVFNEHTDYRLAGVYLLPFESFKQRLNVILSRREETFTNFVTRAARAGTQLNTASNQIYVRRYIDEGDTPFVIPTSGARIFGTPFAVAGQPTDILNIDYLINTDTFEKQVLDTYQIATVGSYWKERISIVGGIRRDNYERSSRSIGARNATTGQPIPEQYNIGATDLWSTTNSIGAVVFPIKAVGVYANYSESFNPAGAGDFLLNGSISQPTRSRGKSVGLRFSLFGNRIVGSAGYYNTFENGRITRYQTSEINQIWEDIGQPNRQINNTTYADTQTAGGEGYEVEFVANVTKALRARFNVALPDGDQRNTIPQTRAYFAQNISVWEAEGNNPNNPQAQRIRDNIAALRVRLDGANENRSLDGLPDYTANVFLNYTVQSGLLKSLRIGGGTNFVGERIIGNQIGRSYDYIYTDAYAISTATLGYSFRWKKARWDVQLNVNNLFDEDDPVYSNVANYNGRAVPSAFYYLDPREAVLTLTMSF